MRIAFHIAMFAVLCWTACSPGTGEREEQRPDNPENEEVNAMENETTATDSGEIRKLILGRDYKFGDDQIALHRTARGSYQDQQGQEKEGLHAYVSVSGRPEAFALVRGDCLELGGESWEVIAIGTKDDAAVGSGDIALRRVENCP